MERRSFAHKFKLAAIHLTLKEGVSIRKIAEELGLGYETRGGPGCGFLGLRENAMPAYCQIDNNENHDLPRAEPCMNTVFQQALHRGVLEGAVRPL